MTWCFGGFVLDRALSQGTAGKCTGFGGKCFAGVAFLEVGEFRKRLSSPSLV